MTDLHETILSVLEDERIDPDDIKAILALVDAAEARAERERRDNPPEPCTMEAQMLGCTCRMSHTHSASIDPPEPIRARDCPVHGTPRDPDEAYDRMRDEGSLGRGGRGTPFIYDRDPEITMIDLDLIPDEGCD